MVRVYRAADVPAPEWRLPELVDLGEFLVPVEDWRELANTAGAADAEP